MSANTAASLFQEIKSRFHPKQLELLDRTRMPKHIAIIPDGNRRWARKRAANIGEGHLEGANTLLETVKAALEIGIKDITFYSFSTENWNRSPEEIMVLMALYSSFLTDHLDDMISHDVKFDTIGDLSALPSFLCTVIEKSKIATQHCTGINLILAFNYGSRDEICRAFKLMLEDYDAHLLEKEDVNEQMIAKYLDTHRWNDPDLLIRTSGELRISNFLLWQIAYAEMYIAPVLWPDFSATHLLDAIIDFQTRQRRWGGD